VERKASPDNVKPSEGKVHAFCSLNLRPQITQISRIKEKLSTGEPSVARQPKAARRVAKLINGDKRIQPFYCQGPIQCLVPELWIMAVRKSVATFLNNTG
jgi:hypothetical protein